MINENDKFKSSLSIDELLRQVGMDEDAADFYSDSKPGKSWSLDDIDALLAQDRSADEKKKVFVERKEEPVIPVPNFSRIYVDSLFKTPREDIIEEEKYEEAPAELVFETAEEKELQFTYGKEQDIFYSEPEPEKPEIIQEIQKEPEAEEVPAEKPEESTAEVGEEIPGLIFDEDFVDEGGFDQNDAITGSQMETNPLRERFINMLKIEKTNELDVLNSNEPIEKPGVIIGKSDFPKTEDLSALPLVIPAEDALKSILDEEKTKVSDGSAKILQMDETQVVDGQMMLHGFSGEEEPKKIDEHLAERELIEKRRQAAKDFKIFDIPESYDETIPSKDADPLLQEGERGKAKEAVSPDKLEYSRLSDKADVGKELRYRRRSGVVKTVLLIFIEAVLLILMSVPKIISLLKIENMGGNSSALIPNILSFVLLVVAGASCWGVIFDGLHRLFHMRASTDSAAALTVIAALAHNFCVLFSSSSGSEVFSAAAIMVLLVNTLGHSSENARVMENFRLCAVTNVSKLHSVCGFEDEKENFEIGRSLLLGTPEVRFSRKIGFPTNFMANSYALNFTDDFCKILVPCSAALGLAVTAIYFFKTGGFIGTLSVLAASLCVAAPVGILCAANAIFHSENKKLNSDGAMVAGFACAQDSGKINAVVIEGVDLFDQSHCDLHGMKDYKNVRIDDVVLYTASMVINSDGPLTEVFDKVISNSRDLLPTVKSLGYEDKMGLSGIIHKQKVLFGNRDLLLNHGVEVPNERNESKYCHDGRKVLYLAIANKIVAMFVVSYALDKSLAPYLQYLESSGVNILVRNLDPNITENMINSGFGLQRGTIRLLSPNSGRIFKKSREKEYCCGEAAVLNDGRLKSFLHSVAACARLGFMEKTVAIAQAVGVAIGLAALMVFVLTGTFAKVGVLGIIGFELIWLAITFAVGMIRGIKD